MYNTAWRIIRQDNEAEDVMQEAFLSAFTQIESFKGEVTFGAWLKKIVVNKSINQLKKTGKVQWVDIEQMPDVEDEKMNNDACYRSVDVKDVLKKIDLLPPKDRLVFSLFFIEGYDYQEITEILNVSYQNSRVMVSRAKSKYQKLFYNG